MAPTGFPRGGMAAAVLLVLHSMAYDTTPEPIICLDSVVLGGNCASRRAATIHRHSPGYD